MADDDDMLRGLPQTRHDPLVHPGGIEQAGKIAAAVRSQTGWRRTAARIGVVLLAVAVLTPFVAWALDRM